MAFRGGVARQRWGGALLLAAVVQFVVCEAVTASQWWAPLEHHGYDYASNWISDLGAPGSPARFEGAVFVSPLHALLDGSLGALAVLSLVSGALLTSLMPATRTRLVVRGLIATFAVGVATVALFPETGHIDIHNNGANLTVASDVLAIWFGLRGGRLGVPLWATRTVLAFGILGSSFGVIFGFDWIDSAVVERVADYSPMAACVAGAVCALVTVRRPAAPELVIDLRDEQVVDLTRTSRLAHAG